MKKQILSISLFIAMAGAALFISSCGKDETPPNISVLGDNPATVSLNTTYTDLGATASDDEDGDVTVNISATDDVNTNLVGTYTVSYTVSDKEGNVGSATRTVIVKNDAEDWGGNYSVHDVCGSQIFDYQQTITVSTTVNNRVQFNKFSDYSGNTNIYATINGSTITVPFQTALDIGNLQEDHNFAGVGTRSGSNFVLVYTDNNVSQGASANCNATYTKQ